MTHNLSRTGYFKFKQPAQVKCGDAAPTNDAVLKAIAALTKDVASLRELVESVIEEEDLTSTEEAEEDSGSSADETGEKE